MAKNTTQTRAQQPAGPGENAASAETVAAAIAAGARPGQPPAKSLGLGDDEAAAAAAGENSQDLERPAAGRQGDDRRPFCTRHNCLMKADKSTATATHYACPVPGCDCRQKLARPAVKVPAEPMRCTNRICAGAANNFLEVEERRTTLANLHMVCPNCGEGVKVPRPSIAPRLAAMREQQATEDFGER